LIPAVTDDKNGFTAEDCYILTRQPNTFTMIYSPVDSSQKS